MYPSMDKYLQEKLYYILYDCVISSGGQYFLFH